MTDVESVKSLSVPLDRDAFLRNLLRHLSGALEEVVGLREASGYVSLVGRAMGSEINADYRRALGVERLGREQIGAVLVDLKRRIGGDFSIVEESEEKIVLANRRCPFGDRVLGRPSLCMMTSNVFGAIAAENAGYARVSIDRAIARGDGDCRITVFFEPASRPGAGEDREYVRA